jgi:thiosulfate/3-mercaptopyruvate sulfurtransferase
MTGKHGFLMGGLMLLAALALVACGQSWSGKELATETSGVTLSREVSRGGYQLVTTPELKSWIDQKKPMMIIDTMPLEDSY